jgi:hypothetical protein
MDVDVESNAAYYRKRAEMERDLAAGAPSEEIMKIHLELAGRYTELAVEFEERSLACQREPETKSSE